MDTLKEQRNKEIIATYHQIASRYDISKMPFKVLIGMVQNSPASRFYMSEDRAARYISEYEQKGDVKLTGGKRRMFEDFYKVYLRQKDRMKVYYKHYIISFCLHQQAPSFYLSGQQIEKILASGK